MTGCPLCSVGPEDDCSDECPSRRQELRTAGEQIGTWTAKRDQLIREAHAQGLSLRAIAEAVGLSHTGVAKILERFLRDAREAGAGPVP